MSRVAITGIGLVTPIGIGVSVFWRNLIAGTSGIRQVTAFDTSGYPVHVGAQVPEFDPSKYLRRHGASEIGRGAQLAVAAARLALEDSGLDAERLDPARVGVCLGTTTGEPNIVEQFNESRHLRGPQSVPASLFPKYPCSTIPARVAAEFGFCGLCLMIPTACAAGNYAIGYGCDLLRSGAADLVLAGGVDPFSRITYTGFARLGAIAPERCQPFDRLRKGMIPGEGAAVLILELETKARARGAHIYAEMLGYGVTCDAHHMTAAHPRGNGAVRSMQIALQDAGASIDRVDYISAHGTGTPTNDRLESIAIWSLFGERTKSLPVSSIKSMLGHTMGAASAIEAAACALALESGIVPPTINFEEPDPECDLDCVPNQARETRPAMVLNNAYAFGGNNACLCLGRVA
jgi:3-oxoacyl-[acyl-carrier-protein] synthase II